MRDYAEEFHRFVDDRTPAGDYVMPVLAAKIVAELEESDPDLLHGWLYLNAEPLITTYLGDRERARRNQNRVDAPKDAFAQAARRFEDGDSEAMTPFQIHLVVDEDNTRRPVGDMTKQDHLFVAGRHAQRANRAQMLAAFHTAVARKIPKGKTTADVMSEEEYLRLRDSIG